MERIKYKLYSVELNLQLILADPRVESSAWLVLNYYLKFDDNDKSLGSKI